MARLFQVVQFIGQRPLEFLQYFAGAILLTELCMIVQKFGNVMEYFHIHSRDLFDAGSLDLDGNRPSITKNSSVRLAKRSARHRGAVEELKRLGYPYL